MYCSSLPPVFLPHPPKAQLRVGLFYPSWKVRSGPPSHSHPDLYILAPVVPGESGWTSTPCGCRGDSPRGCRGPAACAGITFSVSQDVLFSSGVVFAFAW